MLAPSRPLFAGAVKRNLAINDNCHELIALDVLELHHLMTAPRQLPPAAGLLGILLDRPVFVVSDSERAIYPYALATCSLDRY